MVDAVRVFSLGLGGDSEVRFQGGVGLAIGPRRVVPMSLLVHRYPEILTTLEWRVDAAVSPRSNRFAVALFAEGSQRRSFSQEESAAWERLQDGPLDVEHLSNEDRALARALARLVRNGIAIYSGFTPTDAAHVLGKAGHWSTRAAELAAIVWARQMRQVYGWGKFEDNDQQALVQRLRNTWCAQFAPPSSPPASLPIRARRIMESANARRDFSVSGFRAIVRWMEICFHSN